MGTLDLLFVIHSHQPVGNFSHVFQQAFDTCYGPFLDVVEKFPFFKFAYHISGPLLEWLDDHQPDHLEKLRQLVAKGQVEMISGGFYEPILASIPAADAIGQLMMMNDFIKERFGQKPGGFWLTERIWAPDLPCKIAPAGLEYTFVDDTHFIYSGLESSQLFGYRFTESDGHKLGIFPGLKELRYSIPFKKPEDILALFKEWLQGREHLIATYADDGEKFGVWPGTSEWVYKKKWLEKFLSLLEENQGMVKTCHPGEIVKKDAASGRVYMPTASYDEMLKWALPAEAGKKLNTVLEELGRYGLLEKCKRFIRGGTWDNFLVKYPESNYMHKKMLFFSEKSRSNSEALRAVWKSQCNCAYWHGLFGGIYLPHLRHAIYQNLLRSQEILGIGSDPPVIDRFDFDLDGNDEILFHGKSLNIYFAPSKGGRVFEIDHRSSYYNLTNTITRREEIYHEEIRAKASQIASEKQVRSIHEISNTKEENLENWLIYDSYCRGSFLDHFFLSDSSLNSFKKSEYDELGDFVYSPYEITKSTVEKNSAILELERTGDIFIHGIHHSVRLKKTFIHQGEELIIHYRLFSDRLPEGTVRFGIEQNYSLHTGSDPQRFLTIKETGSNKDHRETPGNVFSYSSIDRWEMINQWDGWHLVCESNKPSHLWHFPLETVSHSEEGVERIHQGSCFLNHWLLEMKKKNPWEVTLTLQIKKYKKT